jgi:hypothetical protein
MNPRHAISGWWAFEESERLRTLPLLHLLLESAFGRPALGDRLFQRYRVVISDGVGCHCVRQMVPAKKVV